MYGNMEEILNSVTCGNAALGIILAAQWSGAIGLLEVLCAAGFTVLLLSPFYRAGGLGAGDIKLFVAVSAFMPAQDYLRCFAGGGGGRHSAASAHERQGAHGPHGRAGRGQCDDPSGGTLLKVEEEAEAV